ncbi:hypothetical protein LZC95_27530 [Pendulispora brunnea]|uniref:Uncharacterized protein n=1 Tax=Pendulispora brunnea TaxID=2905690 RepID=A0ABZ2K1J6_9BACT
MHDIREGTCPLCHHNEIVRAMPRAIDDSDDAGSYMLTVTHARTAQLSGMVFSLRPPVAFGIIEAYVCRRCGFVQTFAREPEKIPIGEKFETTLVRGPQNRDAYR